MNIKEISLSKHMHSLNRCRRNGHRQNNRGENPAFGHSNDGELPDQNGAEYQHPQQKIELRIGPYILFHTESPL